MSFPIRYKVNVLWGWLGFTSDPEGKFCEYREYSKLKYKCDQIEFELRRMRAERCMLRDEAARYRSETERERMKRFGDTILLHRAGYPGYIPKTKKIIEDKIFLQEDNNRMAGEIYDLESYLKSKGLTADFNVWKSWRYGNEKKEGGLS